MRFVSVDIGNTLIKLTCFDDGGDVESSYAFQTFEAALIKTRGCHADAVGYCTTRELNIVEQEWIEHEGWWHLPHKSVDLPVGIGWYKTPETLGEDRIAAMAGARSLYPGHPVAVIDFGTAITFDVVDRKGYFLGGNISPGMSMRFLALHEYTSLLPEVGPKPEVPLLGWSTETAIQGGVVRGIIGEAVVMMREAATSYNCKTFVITGGDAIYLEEKLRETFSKLFDDEIELVRNEFIVAKGIKAAYSFYHDRKN